MKTKPSLSYIPTIIKRGDKLHITRRVKGVYEYGEYKQGKECCFNAIGHVQPITGKELLNVADGERHKGHYNIWTEFKLITKDVVRNKCDNLTYEVEIVENWGAYVKARAVLEDGQENASD